MGVVERTERYQTTEKGLISYQQTLSVELGWLNGCGFCIVLSLIVVCTVSRWDTPCSWLSLLFWYNAQVDKSFTRFLSVSIQSSFDRNTGDILHWYFRKNIIDLQVNLSTSIPINHKCFLTLNESWEALTFILWERFCNLKSIVPKWKSFNLLDRLATINSSYLYIRPSSPLKLFLPSFRLILST